MNEQDALNIFYADIIYDQTRCRYKVVSDSGRSFKFFTDKDRDYKVKSLGNNKYEICVFINKEAITFTVKDSTGDIKKELKICKERLFPNLADLGRPVLHPDAVKEAKEKEKIEAAKEKIFSKDLLVEEFLKRCRNHFIKKIGQNYWTGIIRYQGGEFKIDYTLELKGGKYTLAKYKTGNNQDSREIWEGADEALAAVYETPAAAEASLSEPSKTEKPPKETQKPAQAQKSAVIAYDKEKDEKIAKVSPGWENYFNNIDCPRQAQKIFIEFQRFNEFLNKGGRYIYLSNDEILCVYKYPKTGGGYDIAAYRKDEFGEILGYTSYLFNPQNNSIEKTNNKYASATIYLCENTAVSRQEKVYKDTSAAWEKYLNAPYEYTAKESQIYENYMRLQTGIKKNMTKIFLSDNTILQIRKENNKIIAIKTDIYGKELEISEYLVEYASADKQKFYITQTYTVSGNTTAEKISFDGKYVKMIAPLTAKPEEEKTPVAEKPAEPEPKKKEPAVAEKPAEKPQEPAVAEKPQEPIWAEASSFREHKFQYGCDAFIYEAEKLRKEYAENRLMLTRTRLADILTRAKQWITKAEKLLEDIKKTREYININNVDPDDMRSDPVLKEVKKKATELEHSITDIYQLQSSIKYDLR